MVEEKNILIIGIIGCKEPLQAALQKKLTKLGFNIKIVSDINTALEYLRNKKTQVVLLCAKMAGTNQNMILNTIKEKEPSTEVIILDQHSTMRAAFDSMRLGAYDYLIKPFNVNKVVLTIKRAFKFHKKFESNRKTHQELAPQTIHSNMVGETPAMKSILDSIHKVAPTNSSVLIQGETGTGKGLIADAIHKNSLRWDRPFFAVNCTAIPDTLLENELFGHEKGAFTDATCLKYGLLETANGGTLFLDEVSEISSSLQAKLLQVVETGRFRRLGGNQEIQVDLRIISATNKDLYREVVSVNFRNDLYYRLSVVNINVPPLRERQDDIPLIVNFFLDNLRVSGKGRKIVSAEALDMLKKYDWPGNIRELHNVIERAVLFTEHDTIEVADLPSFIQKHSTMKQLFFIRPEERYFTLGELENTYIGKILQKCHGHLSQAAKILGITRQTLYNKLKHLRIKQGDEKGPVNKQ